jgi:subtilisin-like proprotein convertase family protein
MQTSARAFLLTVIVAAAASAVSQADELPTWLTERRIIGENDLEAIEATKTTPAYAFSRVVARVETSDGQPFCTASRLGSDLFLTNFHCFEFAPCESIRFHLGYEKDLPDTKQVLFKCNEVLSKSLSLDYALYRVAYVGIVGGGTVRKHEFHNLGVSIPDNNPNGVVHPFDIRQDGKIKAISLTVKITHPRAGDLKIALKSPSGTEVLLQNQIGTVDVARTFKLIDGMVAYLGAEADGVWELKVSDHRGDTEGVLDSVTFDITTENERLEQGQAENFPSATLWAGELAVDQELIVASHPRGRLKEIDRSATCKIRSVETIEVAERETITHTCDTEGGSSGSPVIDRRTGQIVGLHWGGVEDYNYAIPMPKIVESLEKDLDPKVFHELRIAR